MLFIPVSPLFVCSRVRFGAHSVPLTVPVSDTSGDGKVSRGTESGKHRDNKRISKRFLHLVTVNLSLSHARYSRLSFILFRSRRRVNDRRRAWARSVLGSLVATLRSPFTSLVPQAAEPTDRACVTRVK